MGVDRLTDDDPEEISGALREQQPEHRQQPATGMSEGTEIAESRTRAEYYQALRAAADTEGASADTSPQSAWGNADALTRPPLDALRLPPERAIHILDGDATGGGHRYGVGNLARPSSPRTGTRTR